MSIQEEGPDSSNILLALADRCRVATPSNTVLHNECAYTFYSPYWYGNGGIVVNLNTFIGTIPSLAFANVVSPERDIFLRIIKIRTEKKPTENEDEDARKPTKLALGVEGGFGTDEDKYETVTKHSIVILESPDKVIAEFPFNVDDDDETNNNQFPEQVIRSAKSVIHHVGMAIQQDLAAWQDDEEIPVSKYCTDLPFVENGVTISPDSKTWRCGKDSSATDNLWLNLSDGYIGGGRKHWDGSGGTNGALDHFLETGETYPLVVKLGTITAEGSTVHADCYSYAKDEDGPVKVPNLKELLAKRGIQVAGLQKTEKSTAELEVELNANYAFDAITESGSKLVPVTGPGRQGLVNLGNSCYMNSVLQALSALPEIATRYGVPPGGDVSQHRLFRDVPPTGAPDHLMVQTAKVVSALTSGAYAIPEADLESTAAALTDPKYRVAPRMFKHVIGKDHVDFKTGQQQDSAQFLQYLLEQLDRAEAKLDRTMLSTSSLFAFRAQTRIVCSADQKVKYKDGAPETLWSLRIPMDKAEILPTSSSSTVGGGDSGGNEANMTTTTKDEPEQKKLKQEEKEVPTITFDQCVDAWAAETTLDDYRWPHLGNTSHPGTQRTLFRTFPRYLWIQVQRYKLDATWQPVKLEVNLDIPESIDLSEFQSSGPQDGELLVPDVLDGEGTVPPPAVGTEINELALSQLMDMGFSLNGCKRALMAVGGSDTEAAMNWIFEHNMDPDFNDDPLPEHGGGSGSTHAGVDDAAVLSLVDSLGCFTIDQVRAALTETRGEADRAAEWLFSHMDDLDTAIASLQGSQGGISTTADGGVAGPPNEPMVSDDEGEGKYSLVAMISHIGKNTGSGHYVAHIKYDGKWVIFNDDKVALSENPPLQHAYLYLFQRTDTVGSPNPKY